MKLYAAFAKLDEEARMVYGYASTEAIDSHGEIVSRDALKQALPDFMRFGNIREMHQPSAVGRAADAAIDDKGLYLSAHIIDDAAWAKVKGGVYNGFSIAGHVTARDPADRTIITGCQLSEISLVDRPANPEAVFDLYKRADGLDLTQVQAIHDGACALGASCSGATDLGVTDMADADTVEKAVCEKAAREKAAREKSAHPVLDRLSDELAALSRRLDRLERQPAPAKGALRALAKADDLGDAGTPSTARDTQSLIKMALRAPRSF